jgi:F-type H+-transporting ATPase subunit gamma
MVLCLNGRSAESPLAPRAARLLASRAEWLCHLRERPWPTRNLPIRTVEWRPLFSALVREHLFVTLYRSFAESLAAEQTNRLASMQASEHNIEERLEELRLVYRQQRQAANTEELLDIASGWEALHSAEGEEATAGQAPPNGR